MKAWKGGTGGPESRGQGIKTWPALVGMPARIREAAFRQFEGLVSVGELKLAGRSDDPSMPAAKGET